MTPDLDLDRAHVVVAPDKFKGSATAQQVASAITLGLHDVAPRLRVVEVPIADGGDGTLAAAVGAGFERVPVTVSGPVSDPVEAAIGVRGDVAVVELALAAGLVLLQPDRLQPLRASSFGVGELIRAALDHGCASIVLAIGGSSCTDGGAGMLQALGARFLDAQGIELPRGGGALVQLDSVDLAGLDPRLAAVEIRLASDVDNPLLGEHGAARTYGPQKGASPADVELLEVGLRRLAAAVDLAAADRPGAGAAGGVGFAALAVLGASSSPGIDLVLDLVRFQDQLREARLVVTGEGRLDEQTLHGKGPAGVARAARAAGIPVVVACGSRLLDDSRLRSAGFAAAYALTDVEPDLRQCLERPAPVLRQLGRRIAGDWLGGPR